MFEDLQQRRGMSSKDRARLVTTLALTLVLGGWIYGRTGCRGEDAEPVTLPAAPTKASPPLRELDPARFAELRAQPADPGSFHPLLAYVASEIASGKLARAPARVFDDPADFLAAPPREWTGRLVEVAGTVRSLDKEVLESPDLPGSDQLWAFALEGREGARLVVVSPGLSTGPDGGHPADAYHPGTAPTLLSDGMYVRVRGVYLQERLGAVGSLHLDRPTPVLVGREYRQTVKPLPPIPSIEAADWHRVQDRRLEETRRVDDDVHYQLLVWARSRGAAVLGDELRSGVLPTQPWDQATFLRWKQELAADRGQEEEDPRTWTLAQRGKVFVTTGILADYLTEDWNSIGRNAYDLGVRHKYWIVSDHYANQLFLMDSPFPIEDFPGMREPGEGRRQRVRATGVFVRNYSYTPAALAGRPAGKNAITVPYFIALRLEPLLLAPPGPLWKNPFFWAWVSLAVFGLAFFFVMSRIEKKESSRLEGQARRVREAVRRERAGGPPPRPEPPPPGGEGPA